VLPSILALMAFPAYIDDRPDTPSETHGPVLTAFAARRVDLGTVVHKTRYTQNTGKCIKI